MKPVFQECWEGKWSNCFSACVASLLELTIDDVPDFMWKDGVLNDSWYEDFAEWLKPRGYAPLMFHMPEGTPPPLSDCYYLIGGKSVRDIMHACIGMNGAIAHDPFPSGAGIHEVTDYIVLCRTFTSQDAR